MNRLKIYLALKELIKEMDGGEELINSSGERGSLAYFVDRYYDKDNFGKILEELTFYCNTNEMNLFCWKLCQLIAESRENEMKSCSENVERDLYMLHSLLYTSKECFKENMLRDFWLIRTEDYPIWFIEYDQIEIFAGGKEVDGEKN